MRRINICEERGSGIDKVIRQIELNQMPAPLFEDLGDYTKAVLYLLIKNFQILVKKNDYELAIGIVYSNIFY